MKKFRPELRGDFLRHFLKKTWALCSVLAGTRKFTGAQWAIFLIISTKEGKEKDWLSSSHQKLVQPMPCWILDFVLKNPSCRLYNTGVVAILLGRK